MAIAATTASVSCGSEHRSPPAELSRGEAALEVAPTAAASGPAVYFRARIEETLSGPSDASARAFQRVLDDAVDPVIAARAALELAELAAARRRRRVALELIARASALGASDRDVIDRASQLRGRLAAVSAEDIEVRGPPAGAPLENVSVRAAESFARGEELLAVYLRRRPSSRLEEAMASVRAKRSALETAVRAYQKVVELDEPVAVLASEFRIASMYYDLSLSLTSDLTREMLPSEAAKFRSTLRSIARSNRRQARDAYRRALRAAPAAGESGARWREAAKLGLTSVEDLLRGG